MDTPTFAPHQILARLERNITNSLGRNADVIITKHNPQSIQFMIDIMPTVRKLYPGKGKNISVLDVGSRTGAGAALLARQHAPLTNSKIKMQVTALDISNEYQSYANIFYPEIRYIVGDIFNLDKHDRWDLVICSHTIEHVPDPDRFLGRLINLARDFVILACPYKENPESLIPEHLHSIDDAFLERHHPISTYTYNGMYWYQSDCGIFVFNGSGA